MATNAAIGYATTLGIWNGASYTAVAEITSITPPGFSRDAIEATHMASPSQHREFIAGLVDAGEVALEINYVPAVAEQLRTALTAGVGQFCITHPNGVTCTFSGVVTSYQPSTPIDDKMTAAVTIKVSGVPAWA